MVVDVSLLKQKMLERGMSQKELSAAAGISQVTLSIIFKNGVASYKSLGALINVLDIKPADILPRTKE